jgi:STE24 endopeptidase
MTDLAYAILGAIVLSTGLKIWLVRRQMRAAAAHRGAVPAAFAASVSLPEHQKAADYTVATGRLDCAKSAFDCLLTVAWLSLLLAPFHAWFSTLAGPGVWRSTAEVLALSLLGSLIAAPFGAYRTFAVEERFGFNRTSVGLWLKDLAKGWALMTVIGGALFAGMFWLLGHLSGLWWLWAWAGTMAVSVAAGVVYPLFIAPLFNKFEPLPDGAVKERVEALLSRCGFASGGLFVMDASKRSTRGNAYFTGFGRAKRIVFFDTLLSGHGADEIEAVLAHEIGHFKHRHIVSRLGLAAVQMLAVFAALGWAFGPGGLAQQFGLPADPGLTLVVGMSALEPLLRLCAPITNWFSRRAEFQADAYAKATVGGRPLSDALVRLSRDNAQTLTPDPLFAAFNYGHPPVPERVARLA